MLYVADTHALVKYLVGILPNRPKIIFEESEKGLHTIYIPTIVLAESFYLIRKKKIALNFDGMIAKIENSKNFSIVNFNLDIVKLFPTIKEMEIHDQIIVATAKHLNVKLISQDKEIIASKEVETVW